MDRYPFLAEIKGDVRMIRPLVIIVTSNYSPRDIWPNESDYAPIERRCEVVCFDSLPASYLAFRDFNTMGQEEKVVLQVQNQDIFEEGYELFE